MQTLYQNITGLCRNNACDNMGYEILDHHPNVRVGVLDVWENTRDNNLRGCSFVLAAYFPIGKYLV